MNTNGPYTEDQIIAIGGNAWSKGGKSRVYLNDWYDTVGLVVDFYKSGNISSASLDGGPISNTKATRPISNTKATRLTMAKIYWEDGRIVTGSLVRIANADGFDGAELERRLLEAIAERVPPAE